MLKFDKVSKINNIRKYNARKIRQYDYYNDYYVSPLSNIEFCLYPLLPPF